MQTDCVSSFSPCLPAHTAFAVSYSDALRKILGVRNGKASFWITGYPPLTVRVEVIPNVQKLGGGEFRQVEVWRMLSLVGHNGENYPQKRARKSRRNFYSARLRFFLLPPCAQAALLNGCSGCNPSHILAMAQRFNICIHSVIQPCCLRSWLLPMMRGFPPGVKVFPHHAHRGLKGLSDSDYRWVDPRQSI